VLSRYPCHRLFDRTLARRSCLFFQVELFYQPTSASGNIVSVKGFGSKEKPWVATISVSSTAGIVVGMKLSATAAAGAVIGVVYPDSKSATVTAVVPDTSITYEFVGCDSQDFAPQAPKLGSITDIVGFHEDPLPVVKYSLSSC
jgi:hypothetical protein